MVNATNYALLVVTVAIYCHFVNTIVVTVSPRVETQEEIGIAIPRHCAVLLDSVARHKN